MGTQPLPIAMADGAHCLHNFFPPSALVFRIGDIMIIITPEIIDARRQDLIASAARSRHIEHRIPRPSAISRMFARLGL